MLAGPDALVVFHMPSKCTQDGLLKSEALLFPFKKHNAGLPFST